MRYAIVDGAGTVVSLVDLDEGPAEADLLDGHRAVPVGDRDVEIDGVFNEAGAYSPPIKVKVYAPADAADYAVVDEGGDIVNMLTASPGHLPEAPAGCRLVLSEGYVIGGHLTKRDKYTPPPQAEQQAPPMRGHLSKVEFWRRCTDEEAEAMEDALQQAPAKLRRLFADAAYIDHNAPEFPALREGIERVVGEARAAELLRPAA